jgi:hypothetical protein
MDSRYECLPHARSVGLFRGQSWQVVPYPVDCASSHPSAASFQQNLDQLSVALKEWIGMLANRVLGHSPEWFPGIAITLKPLAPSSPISAVSRVMSVSGRPGPL